MLSLKKPEVYHYSIGDHVDYHGLAYPICAKYSSVIQSPALITTYQAKLVQEQNIYKWIRSSEYTEKKMEANHNCDGLYIRIEELVRFNLKNFNPSLRDNALHVNNLLKGYGDVPHLDYDAESSAITSVITRLRSAAYLPAATALGIVPWINELETQNNLFKSYAAEAEKEQVNRPEITALASRRETDFAQRAITDRVTAMIVMNGEANYMAFADEFNTLTNHYNTLVHEHYGRLHARTDISHADVDTIADQPFAGEPVYVIPKVSVTVKDREGKTKTVSLVFAVDFTVSYEDNTAPGTAKLFIHGIGHYVGEQTVSFNIKFN